ncbi:MAG: orotidine-5'-phosphate decarboxylase [Muribaculaceae bacterium]|nr:orotidine-5'-phosphate decarboxylase [Muribaculaceae bacterium]
MTRQQLIENIKGRRSFLCVGLDTDPAKMPAHIREGQDPIFTFNKAIIDATAPYCVAYKPNTAFYESQGLKGWEALERTVRYLKDNYPDHLVIADAKRGDIGNTSRMYAATFFDAMGVDAVTVAPYMGEDSVTPFLGYDDKWVILLALTSNKGSHDFQFIKGEDGKPLWERVIRTSAQWAGEDKMMYVVGATQGEMFSEIRRVTPKSFLLVPGVGAQGGSLEQVCKYGMTPECGLLVNSSRGIIYASQGTDFAEAAAAEAQKLQQQMAAELQKIGLV